MTAEGMCRKGASSIKIKEWLYVIEQNRPELLETHAVLIKEIPEQSEEVQAEGIADCVSKCVRKKCLWAGFQKTTGTCRLNHQKPLYSTMVQRLISEETTSAMYASVGWQLVEVAGVLPEVLPL